MFLVYIVSCEVVFSSYHVMPVEDNIILNFGITKGKWFEPRGISYLFSMIIWVRVVFRKIVVGDWCFDYLRGSHLQSQVKSRHQMMVYYPSSSRNISHQKSF